MPSPGWRSLGWSRDMWFWERSHTPLLLPNVRWFLQPPEDSVHTWKWLIYCKWELPGGVWPWGGLATDGRTLNAVKDFSPVTVGVWGSSICRVAREECIIRIKSGNMLPSWTEWISVILIKRWSSFWKKKIHQTLFSLLMVFYNIVSHYEATGSKTAILWIT